MISIADQEKLTATMKAMQEHELAVAELYRAAAAAFPPDEVFWMHLATMEILHADNLERMIALMRSKPARFEMGRPFNMIALQTGMNGIRENIAKISQGALSRMQMLFLAKDIEQSLLEARYGEIVKTADVEYQTLLKEVVGQTYEHKQEIQKQIDRAQKET